MRRSFNTQKQKITKTREIEPIVESYGGNTSNLRRNLKTSNNLRKSYTNNNSMRKSFNNNLQESIFLESKNLRKSYMNENRLRKSIKRISVRNMNRNDIRERVSKSINRISQRVGYQDNFRNNLKTRISKSIKRISVRNMDKRDIRKSVKRISQRNFVDNKNTNYTTSSRIIREGRLSTNYLNQNLRKSVRRVSRRKIENPRRSVSRIYITHPKIVSVNKSTIFDQNDFNKKTPFSQNREILNNNRNENLRVSKKITGILKNGYNSNVRNTKSFVVSKENGNNFRSKIRNSLVNHRLKFTSRFY